MLRKNIVSQAPWIFAVILVAWLFTVPSYITSGYYLGVAMVIFVSIVLAASFRLTVSAGLFSMGQNAFAILAAFTAGYLSRYAGLSFFLAILVGSVLAVLLALVIGWLVLRVKGVYFAIVTMALGEIALMSFVSYWPTDLGGSVGILGVASPRVTIGSLDLNFATRGSFYSLLLGISVLCMLALWWIEHSRIGLILKAIREEDNLAQAVGVKVFRYKLFAFSAQAFFTALVASTFIYSTHMVSPYDYTGNYILNLIVYTVVGGVGSFAGPVVGASLMTILAEVLRRAGAFYDVLAMGAILMLVMLFMPEGLVGAAKRIPSWTAKLTSRPGFVWKRLLEVRKRSA